MVKTVKSLLVLASFVATAMWALDPAGIYEPLIAFFTAGLAAFVHFSPKPAPSTISIDGQPIAFAPTIGWNGFPQSGELTAWLEWRTRLTTLIGREAEQKALRDWANASDPLSFKVIQADGGVGKTRLAAELAQSLLDTKRWTGGFVSLATFERAQRLAWQGNTIIVVDYPEHSPERLAQLIVAAKEGLQAAHKKQKLRILLLCRSSEGVNDLLNKQGAQTYVSKAMLLGELAGKGNLNLLNQSLSKLAPTAPSVSEQEFQTWLDQSKLHGTALFVVALALHLSTLPAETSRFLPGAQLLQALLKREQARWAKAETGHGLPQGVITDVVAFATLFDGLPLRAINTSLNDAYQLPPNTLGKLHSALAELWPLNKSSQTYPPLAPDLLAAVLLWHWRREPVKQGVSTDAQLLVSLAPPDQTSFTALLQRWHMQAYDQVVRLQLGLSQESNSLAVLLNGSARLDTTFTAHLTRAFQSSTRWTGLADLAVYASKPKTNSSSSSNSERVLAARSLELNNFSIALARAGDRSSALAAGIEAVCIRRRLAIINPGKYKPNLASSINNLANRLFESGNLSGALAAAGESVDIRRHLVESNPLAYESGLAASIINLANLLDENGDRAGALAGALEAVEIYRRLAQVNPAAYEPNLAASVNNLANFLSETSDRAASLEAAREAVDIRRRLAKTNRAAYEPDLAVSITNLSIALRQAGDHPAAIIAAREALDMFARLAKTNPAVYMPELALSNNNMARALAESGDHLSALSIAREAVALYEKANQQTPGAFCKQFAIAKQLLDALLRRC